VTTAESKLSRRRLVLYALPAAVLSLPTIPVYIFLPALYGVSLGIGLAATGGVLLLARLFDALTDPLMGLLADRRSVLGAWRKPWIIAGAIVAGVGLLRLLDPPPAVGAWYLLFWSIVLYGGWTMVSIPYSAWGAELSAKYDERTRITTWREAFGLGGILAAGGLNLWLLDAGMTSGAAITALAWAAVVTGAIAFPLLLVFVPEGAHQRASRPGGRALASLFRLARNRPFLRLLSAWFLNGLANGIPAALFLLYLEHGLGAGERQRPFFILLYFVAAVLAMPLWLALSRRYGKHRTWCVAMISACIAFAMVPLFPERALVAFAVVCFVCGMALGADLALPPAIQADVADFERMRNGVDRTATLFALWGLGTKLALAAGVGIALPAVAWFGFDPAAAEPTGKLALVVIYALFPVVLKALAIATMWGFPLTPERHAIIRRRIDASRSRRV
jgi:GPH family glycoside/pentoside/hexuronide:cation symporter